MRETHSLFYELIQVSLGNKGRISHAPTASEWNELLELASQHAIAAVLIDGVGRLIAHSKELTIHQPVDLRLEWIGLQQITQSQNELQNRRSRELVELFGKSGFRSCILKGQGTATYYPQPGNRQCGDIDLWVEAERDEVLAFARQQGYTVNSIDQKHSDVEVFADVPVEVHFKPSWMYNPFRDKKLQRFFKEKADRQFGNTDERAGFVHTTVDFDLVFSMVHIYRHVFSEGIGLRQLMDYYFILKASMEEQRREALKVLKALGMGNFVGGIMWILRECFGMGEALMLCMPNERHGSFLLEEIMRSGNFGQYDERTVRVDKNERFKRGLAQFKRNLRFIGYYPSEVLWSPAWKLGHYFWRKRKGYL